MHTLGINAAFHDPAACLVRDGKVLAAAEEERFTRVKHGKRPVPFSTWELPFHAIDFCLRHAGIKLIDVDHIAYSFDPFLLLGGHQDSEMISLPLEPSKTWLDACKPQEWESAWDPLFLSSIVNAPRHLAGGYPHHLQESFHDIRWDGPFRWHFVAHHLAHAASAYYPSPFNHAAVMTLDGRGERATTSYAVGQGSDMELLEQVQMPHSLGLLYEEITRHLGFLHSSDEYKVMALASYGKPAYLKEFREMVILGSNGQYRIAQSLKLEEKFGPPRRKGASFEQRHFDIAHSLQAVLEETVLELARRLQGTTGAKHLCLAGGMALNCVMNAKIRDQGLFQGVWTQPAAGDAGTALGAALWIDAKQRSRDASNDEEREEMSHVFLGPEYSDDQIESFLRWSKLPWRRLQDIAKETAEILAHDKIIGWLQGRMEFGPRALGGRSILASPIRPEMQAKLNDIKEREDFRPVAPVVLEEEAARWFKNAKESPFMLFVHDVLPERAGQIPAVCHIDGTARIQTINRRQNPRYYDLIKAFQVKTGVPVLVNTSFNTRGEPIVCSPRDAIECFWTSPLDALVIGSFLLEKKS